MSYKLIKKLDNGVRIGELATMHGSINTPFFMPVGTVGSVKAMAPWELKELGAEIMLSNTYHLYLRPGEKQIKELGGLHKFIGWDRPILTDSGGYQVFSLGREKNYQFPISNFQSSSNNYLLNEKLNENELKNGKFKGLVRVTESGVEFKSHLDGSKHLFTPEKVIDIQLDLGVDIMMPLDVCPSGKATKKEVEWATKTSIEWLKRSKKYFFERMSKPETQITNENCKLKIENSFGRPLLHGIVQGGMYPDLRKMCLKEMIALDMDGYSIGGLAVDLETREMWDIVKLCCNELPEDKQRYLMGVGTPDDIIKATQLGVDMFDCVLPTRLARHASVYIQQKAESEKQKVVPHKLINLLNSQYRTDPEPIDPNCGCPACKQKFSKAYISHLLRSNEILGLRLTTLHNLWTYLELMREIQSQNN